MAKNPSIPASPGNVWKAVFYDDFTAPDYKLNTNFRHSMGSRKWKWDADSGKEIWWEPACSKIVPDTTRSSKPILQVCVYSDWFHRIDRLATKQTFGYGYYESRCRFKGASGMHSAFWLLPESMQDDPVPPGEILGGVEIDVVENRKVDSAGNDLSKQGNTAVHWGGYGANHKSVAFKVMALPDNDPSEWATFGVSHWEGGITWYWNGQEVNSARVWSPVKNSMYFSTEVNESSGWAGKDLVSYGSVDHPEGFIEVDYCGFWEQSAAVTETETGMVIGRTETVMGTTETVMGMTGTRTETVVGTTETVMGMTRMGTETVVGTMETVMGTTETVMGTTETVVGTTETVVGTTKTVMGTTETVIGMTGTGTETVVGTMETVMGMTGTGTEAVVGTTETVVRTTETVMGTTETVMGMTGTGTETVMGTTETGTETVMRAETVIGAGTEMVMRA